MRLDLRRANGVRLGLQVIYVVSPEHIGNILENILIALAMLAVWGLDTCDGRHVCDGAVRRRGRRAGNLAAQPGISRQDGVPLVRRKIVLRQEFFRK